MQQRINEAVVQLFCFPYAGGSASIFSPWQAELGPAIRVHPVQLPGRDARMREPLLTSVPSLATTLAAEIANTIDRPFAVFGYSFGALLAFETARLLAERGLQPAHLFVAALQAPQCRRSGKKIHHLPTAEFADEIRRLKGTPEAVLQHPELMDLFLPRIRADFRAYETYEYKVGPPLACAMSAMGGAADPSVPLPMLRAWSAETAGEFRVRIFPGDHFFIHTARSLLTWAIRQDLVGELQKRRETRCADLRVHELSEGPDDRARSRVDALGPVVPN